MRHPVVDAQQGNDRAGGKGDAFRQIFEVLQDPAAVALGKVEGFADRRAPGQDHDHALAGFVDPEADPPGPRVALQFHRDFAVGQIQTAGLQGLKAENTGCVAAQRHGPL